MFSVSVSVSVCFSLSVSVCLFVCVPVCLSVPVSLDQMSEYWNWKVYTIRTRKDTKLYDTRLVWPCLDDSDDICDLKTKKVKWLIKCPKNFRIFDHLFGYCLLKYRYTTYTTKQSLCECMGNITNTRNIIVGLQPHTWDCVSVRDCTLYVHWPDDFGVWIGDSDSSKSSTIVPFKGEYTRFSETSFNFTFFDLRTQILLLPSCLNSQKTVFFFAKLLSSSWSQPS